VISDWFVSRPRRRPRSRSVGAGAWWQSGWTTRTRPDRTHELHVSRPAERNIPSRRSARFEDEDDDEYEDDVRWALHFQQPVDARFLRGLKLQMTFDGGCDKRQIVSGQPPADKGDQ
jgi:hypothetical protein